MTPPKKVKNPHAVALGRNGGKARKAALTAERRSEIARAAINARWDRERAKLAAVKVVRSKKRRRAA